MLSKRGSLKKLRAKLKEAGAAKGNMWTTEWTCGGVTRFGLAWNWKDHVRTFEKPTEADSADGMEVRHKLSRSGLYTFGTIFISSHVRLPTLAAAAAKSQGVPRL